MYQQMIPLIITLAAILAGILLNNKHAQDLKADFLREIERLNSRLDVIESDMRQFYHLNVKLEGRVDSIEKRLG